MLTTPVKRTERARASEDAEFERTLKAWPSGFADSREISLEAWQSLSPDERTEAESEISRFVSTTKSIGRSHICSFANYLSERRWKALPERPKPVELANRAAPSKPVKRVLTDFQIKNPHLYPELFPEQCNATG